MRYHYKVQHFASFPFYYILPTTQGYRILLSFGDVLSVTLSSPSEIIGLIKY